MSTKSGTSINSIHLYLIHGFWGWGIYIPTYILVLDSIKYDVI